MLYFHLKELINLITLFSLSFLKSSDPSSIHVLLRYIVAILPFYWSDSLFITMEHIQNTQNNN